MPTKADLESIKYFTPSLECERFMTITTIDLKECGFEFGGLFGD